MKKIEIVLNDKLNIKELKKLIGFVSEDILIYQIRGKVLSIEVHDDADCIEIEKTIVSLANNYVSNAYIEEEKYRNEVKIPSFFCDFKSIHYFDEGMISLSAQSKFLYSYFDRVIDKFIERGFHTEECRVITKVYPVLLPMKVYKKTGYLKRTPQYAFFCCSLCENLSVLNKIDKMNENEYRDIINNPQYALSPSACFHVYEELKGKTLDKNTIVTFTQSVFRNEGRFNFAEFGRMRDYHVREIVFIGNSEFVNKSRNKVIDFTKKLVEDLGLNAKIITASDPFILPRMQKLKKMQIKESSKYELRMVYTEEEDMSVASFNIHGTAFTYPFDIKIKNLEETVTGCVGYGLERLVLAFLSQYGENVSNWPEDLQKEYEKIL